MRPEWWLYTLRLRLRSLFRWRVLDEELDAELQYHIQCKTDDNVARGMSPNDARRAAQLDLRGIESTKEECRDARGLSWFQNPIRDVRYSLRVLRKSPGFSIVAIVTLALGIGANTAIFSLIDAILLRDLPVRDPSQLVEVIPAERNGDNAGMSLVTLEELERRQHVFSAILGWWGDAVVNAEIRGAYERVDLYAVDGKFYSGLGASPYLGRFISASDVNLHAGAPAQVAVLGYDFWRSRFNSDRSVIGQTIRIETVPFEIIGVSGNGFTGMSASSEPEITIPLTAEPLVFGEPISEVYDRKWQGLDVTARLKKGVTFEQASAQLQALWPNVQTDTAPADDSAEERREYLSHHLEVKRAGKGFTILHKRFVEPLTVLIGIAALVLLIACVNLASLLMSRGAARGHEIGVRLALGASRTRLIWQLLTEALVLSVAGATLGLGLARWSTSEISDFILSRIFIVPARLNLTTDERILSLTIAAAIFTGLLFGIAPALSITRHDTASALRGDSRIFTTTARPARILVSTQVALSFVLLMCAALFVRSLAKLRSTNPGFRTEDVVMASLFPKPDGYKDVDDASYYRQMIEEVGHLPGVAAVGISHGGPSTPYKWNVLLSSDSGTPGRANSDADLRMFSPGVFAALRMTIEQGRDFSWSDDGHAPRVAILSEDLAKQLFPRGDAIGRHVRIEPGDYFPFDQRTLQVIGVVNNASMWNIREVHSLEIYVPALQTYIEWSDLLMRADADPRALRESLQHVVESMGHEYVTRQQLLKEHVDESLLEERLTAMFAEFFGALALLLASIGLYGLMSYTVTQRTRDIGIRMALGAQSHIVLGTILREAVALILTGVAIGIPCALFATRLIANQLFGLSPRDPLTFLFVAITLLSVGALAAYLPSRRAMRIAPTVALRHE